MEHTLSCYLNLNLFLPYKLWSQINVFYFFFYVSLFLVKHNCKPHDRNGLDQNQGLRGVDSKTMMINISPIQFWQVSDSKLKKKRENPEKRDGIFGQIRIRLEAWVSKFLSKPLAVRSSSFPYARKAVFPWKRAFQKLEIAWQFHLYHLFASDPYKRRFNPNRAQNK